MAHDPYMTTYVMRDGAQAFLPCDAQASADEWTRESERSFGMENVLSMSDYDDAFWQIPADTSLRQRQTTLDEFEEIAQRAVPARVADEEFAKFRVGVQTALAEQQRQLEVAEQTHQAADDASVSSVISAPSVPAAKNAPSPSMSSASRFPANPFLAPRATTSLRGAARKSAAERVVAEIMPDKHGEDFRRGMARFFGLVGDYAAAIGEMYFPGFDRRTYNYELRDWRLAFFHYYGDNGTLTPTEIVTQLRELYLFQSHRQANQHNSTPNDFLA